MLNRTCQLSSALLVRWALSLCVLIATLFWTAAGVCIPNDQQKPIATSQEERYIIWERSNAGDLAYGYIDKTGNVAIRPKYQDAYPFSEGLARVFVKGRWSF